MRQLVQDQDSLMSAKLVVKPDQLIKRRGRAGLVGIKLDWEGVKAWIAERMEREIQVEHATGVWITLSVNPFCLMNKRMNIIFIQSEREGDEILFCSEGGVDVGDVDAKAKRLFVAIDDDSLSTTAILESRSVEGSTRAENGFSCFLCLDLFSSLSHAQLCLCGNQSSRVYR